MKVILVIDTPKTCKECPCQLMLVCVPADEDIDEYIDPSKAKPDWCPLKPLPDRENPTRLKDGTYFKAYDTGWNDCLKEITGETE